MPKLNVFTIAPDQTGYTEGFGTDTISAGFDVLAIYRRNVFNNARAVSVSWICKPCEYNYVMAAYRAWVAMGGAPFLIDLILDKNELTRHKAVFQRGSLQLQNVKGYTYTIAAILIVEPTPYDTKTRPYVVDSGLKDLTLRPNTGIYLMTGQDVKFKRNGRKMAAATGHYTLTGQNTLGDTTMAADTGYYTITGQTPANLTTQGGDHIVTQSSDNIVARL